MNKLLCNLELIFKNPLILVENLWGWYKKRNGDFKQWNITRCKVAYLKTRRALSNFFEYPLNQIDRMFIDLCENGVVDHLSDFYTLSLKSWPKGWPMDFAELTVLYIILRMVKPYFVIETGVGYGFSSSIILQALEENGKGVLFSIDINEKVGDAIPDRLKSRWRLYINPSRVILPKLLNKLRQIQFFLHDSLNTYENMNYEFQSVFPHLVEGGILASHDAVKGEGKKAFDNLLLKSVSNKVFQFHNLRILEKRSLRNSV